MTITEVERMMKRIHDAEGWHLGTSSTRETRNAFMERVVGCAHWGHPVYNPGGGDKQWHCKDPDGPGGRPASDDVIVSMPERKAWDMIPGAGADGYRIEADRHPFILEGQFIFVPAKPSGAGFPEPDVPGPAKPAKPGYPGDHVVRDSLGAVLAADYAERPQAMDDGSVVWAFRVCWDHVVEGMDLKAAITKHRNGPGGWRQALGLPPK